MTCQPASGSVSPRVMLITASIGAGHNSVAGAMKTALEKLPLGLDVRRIDTMQIVPRWFRFYYAVGFFVGMTHLPRAFAAGFKLLNRPTGPDRSLLERIRLGLEFRVLDDLARTIERDQPELILHTHFLASPMVADLARQGRFKGRQAVVATDIELHRFWYSHGVDHWFVPHDHSAGQLQRWGIKPPDITVSGIPLHEKWTAPLDRQKIYTDWNLPADRPIVLVSGGTDFVVGPVVETVRGIVRACPGKYVVVLTGRNKSLHERISSLNEAPQHCRSIPFTDRVNELVEVASLMVTKPGGITTAECLAKGTPMVLPDPVPGHEGGNAEFLQANGAAIIARGGAKVVVDVVGRLMDDKSALAGMSQQAKRLYRPGTKTVIDWVVRALGLG